VEKKTYRESLLNNRDTVLFSKKMATIDCDVPVDLRVEEMRAGEPDVEALRALFTEMEFTSLLKELLPVAQVSETHYTEASSPQDVESVLSAVRTSGALAVAVEGESAVVAEETDEQEMSDEQMLPLSAQSRKAEPARCLAISAESGTALTVSLENAATRARLASVLADENLPKAIHQYKAALHILEPQAITLNGILHDPAL